MYMNGLQDAVINLLAILITGAVTVLSAKATAYFKQKGMLDLLKTKQDTVKIAVNAAEQIYKVEDGQVRYDKAKKRAVQMLNEQLIPITDIELDSLIEAAVIGMKQGYEQNR
ncbi:hypothetical protein CBF37_11215 [Vagococcus vulneris]|uniref:Phage holin n=2 Tax=Vagococcus vulneris TaxID=1977869 RepID=A0A429ZR76_9ENTE|nr:hypothetical protein CBF37_11215 [Vagococcus vulneris]